MKRTRSFLDTVLKWILSGGVESYRLILRPLLNGHCRFEPSCSAYALDALRMHGGLTGTRLILKRVGRCHPWGGMGYDPVPSDSPLKLKHK